MLDQSTLVECRYWFSSSKFTSRCTDSFVRYCVIFTMYSCFNHITTLINFRYYAVSFVMII